MPQTYIERILRARIYDLVKETPLQAAERLSEKLANQVLLKREDQQPVFSFKLRGAYNKALNLSEEELARGVIAASAGNHAQGLALSAKHLKRKATIVMPQTTPPIKVQAVKGHGGRTILHGDNYDAAFQKAMELCEEKGMTFVHPFDDPEVIAGQGTVGMEILRQSHCPPDAIFVPVGGGGLIAGIGAYVKYLYPQTKIIGVEPEDAPTLHKSLEAGRRVILNQVGLFADGVAVKQIGKETFRLAKQLVDEVILVTTDEICAAIKDGFDDTRNIVEPAGALAVAGMKKYVQRTGVTGQTLVAIQSGANMNFDRLRHVAERAELGEQREALLAVEIPERPGSFLGFCRALNKRSITEFNYRYSGDTCAHVFVGIETGGDPDQRQALVEHLRGKDYPVLDITNNETAKLHVRYMVGGHAPDLKGEYLFRFEFPERPGALQDFLSHLGKRWNISLFHYRNHGAAYGRVLMGVQIDPGKKTAFKEVLKAQGFPCWEETDNPAYRLFAAPQAAAMEELG